MLLLKQFSKKFLVRSKYQKYKSAFLIGQYFLTKNNKEPKPD